VDGIKRRDPDAIENSLDEIDSKIPREKIRPEDQKAFERARALVRKLRNPPSKFHYIRSFIYIPDQTFWN